MEKQLVINTILSVLALKKELVGIRTWQQTPGHIQDGSRCGATG